MSRNLSVGSSYDGKVINTMLHKLDMRYVVTMITRQDNTFFRDNTWIVILLQFN